MAYQESAQNSVIYAKAAIETMTREGIAATPPNFMIWYNYHTGHNPELCRTLDVLLSNGQRFTAERGAEVFEHFFGTDTESAAVEAVGARIEAAIGRIMAAIGDAGDDAGKFGDALKTFSGQLEGGEQPSDLRVAISTILHETQQMDTRNRQLEGAVRQTRTGVQIPATGNFHAASRRHSARAVERFCLKMSRRLR